MTHSSVDTSPNNETPITPPVMVLECPSIPTDSMRPVIPREIPRSHREHHPLRPVDIGTLYAVALVEDGDLNIKTPIGAMVQVGQRVDPSEPFDIADLAEVPKTRKGFMMNFSQIPLMVYHRPPMNVGTLDPIFVEGYGRAPNSDDVIMSYHNTKKVSEMVLAVNAHDFIKDVIIDQGTPETPNFIEEGIYNDLTFVRRDWCESDKRFMQLLPYVVLYKIINGTIRIFVYQRGKGTGEQRLAGGCSIGLGGHINPHDFLKILPGNMQSLDDLPGVNVSSSTYIGDNQRVVAEGFWTGIVNNIERELNEEVTFGLHNSRIDFRTVISKQVPEDMSIEEWIHSKTVFFSDYRADDVEKSHLGMFIAIQVPDNVSVTTREEELVDLGYIELSVLANEEKNHALPSRLECWSKSIVESISLTIAHNSSVGPTTYTDGPISNKYIVTGKHAIEAADVAKIPQGNRWAYGTISQIFGRQYKYYAMNAFIRT